MFRRVLFRSDVCLTNGHNELIIANRNGRAVRFDENEIRTMGFNNPFINHELMSISLNSTSKWKARNMPSFLAYIDEQKKLPKCLTMSLAAYIAFYSNDIQERTADGLICKRPAGNTYKIQDDAWALDFYYAHKDDTAAQLVHAVLTNTQMWDQDLTQISGLEAAVLADLEKIRTEGAEAAYKSCL